MTTTTTGGGNATKLMQAERAWDELLAEAIRRGFHGTAAVEVVVQDGTIQYIHRRLEKIEK